MRKRYLTIKNNISRLAESGFIHIIISSTLVKVVSFVSAMFLPRIIADKSEYGLLSYVDNIRSYILLFNGLGIMYAIMRFCTKENDKTKKWGRFKAIVRVGILFDAVIVLFSIIAILIIPEKFEGERNYILISSFMPFFFFLFESIQLFLRSSFKNKEYSQLNFVFTILMVILQIISAFYAGVKGVLFARYAAIITAITIGIYYLRQTEVNSDILFKVNKNEMKQMISFGFVMMLSNIASSIMSLNETQFIANFSMDEAIVADYKVATYMFVISTFISMSIATFIYPYFAKHLDDKKWVWNKYKLVMKINIPLMAILHTILWFLCEPFTHLIFGEQYMGAVPFMKLLLIASFGQTSFRMLTGNIMASTGREKTNLFINIVSIFVHWIVCNISMATYGIYGVVIGPIVVYYLSSVPMVLALRKSCKTDIIMEG